jgi:wyosine [tRNA(Phe)-imidazoG37] synthetase (radical SAM superfamily)
MTNPEPQATPNVFAAHPREFEQNRYVYPVVSRRSAGVSIGINLNLDKVCNFDCVYCQVNREEPGEKDFVDLPRLRAELDAMVERVVSGRIYEETFRNTPPPLRRLNDLALSGDGEPTTFRNFDEVAALCAEVRRQHGLDDVKIVLITNATMFDRPRVQRGLAILDSANGEIWAKLDAGTETYYRTVARSAIPFHRILDNLLLAARVRPIVIQTLFMRIRGEGPSVAEQEAYCGRLSDLIASGGQIRLVQIHTIARPPAESWVASLDDAEVDAIAALVRTRTALPVAAFYR